MQKKKDDFEPVVGETYGYVKVVFGPFLGNGGRHWACECKCGTQIAKDIGAIRNAIETGRGGCLPCGRKAIKTIDRPTYAAYYQIRDKCSNPNSPQYKNFGEAGIKMCDSWQESYDNFLKDMGARPGPEYVLGRKDGALGFSPENTQWMTRSEFCKINKDRINKAKINDAAIKVRMVLEREAQKCHLPLGELFRLASLVPAFNLSLERRGQPAGLDEYKDCTVGGYLKMIGAPEAEDMAMLSSLGKKLQKASTAQGIPQKEIKGRVVYPQFLVEQEYFNFLNDLEEPPIQPAPVVIESAAKSAPEKPDAPTMIDGAAAIDAFFN